MNTWNAFPAEYRDKVITTITAELRRDIIGAKPINGTLLVIDTSPEEIDADMMSALIAEPLPVVPPYQQMQIPLAVNEELIDTEDGIIPDDATGEDAADVLVNGHNTDEIREGTEDEDVGEDEDVRKDKESGDAGQEEEFGGAGQDEESGDAGDASDA
jgi:hypothetical protein